MNKLFYKMTMDKKRVDTLYTKILPNLKESFGKIVAIEPESGDYFVGEDITAALVKARQKYPKKLFFFKRVGARATFFVGAL